MRHALALLVLPALASAAPPKFQTTMAVTVEGAAASFAINDAKLDACWKKPTKVKAKVTIESGKITKVELLENSQPRTAVCLKKALLAATTDATSNVVATVELESKQVVIERILERDLSTSLAKFKGIKGGKEPGAGVGVGHGTGVGGSGHIAGDFTKAPGDAAPSNAPKEVKVVIGEPTTEGNGLSAEPINRVIVARRGIWRSCYQKELDRNPGLGGKLVMTFTIAHDGVVSTASATKASTLKNDNVESCVKSNILRLKFPPPGNKVNVTYPFIFAKES